VNILSTFEAIRQRHTVRGFSTKKVPDQLIFELLELTNSAPSGFNLQPWHFVLVRDNDLKELLYHIALDQEQIMQAPYVVAFVADPQAWKKPYDTVLAKGVESHWLTQAEADVYRKMVNQLFSTDPFGLFGIIKRVAAPIRRLFKPLPRVITSRQEAVDYVRAHTMLAVGTFLIAAAGANLVTCPIEGFDEDRLKKLLAVPSSMSIPLIVAFGYPMEEQSPPHSVRLPLIEKLSVDLFPNKLSKLKK
jgi:nitroreductase